MSNGESENHEWYIVLEGERSGPHTVDGLRQLAATGTIDGGTPVWSEGMADWARLDHVPELAHTVTPHVPVAVDQRAMPVKRWLYWAAALAFLSAGWGAFAIFARRHFLDAFGLAFWLPELLVVAAIDVFLLITLRSLLVTGRGLTAASLPLWVAVGARTAITLFALIAIAVPLPTVIGYLRTLGGEIALALAFGGLAWVGIRHRERAPGLLVPYAILRAIAAVLLFLPGMWTVGEVANSVGALLLGTMFLQVAKGAERTGAKDKSATIVRPWARIYTGVVFACVLIGAVLQQLAVADSYDSAMAFPAITFSFPQWMVFETTRSGGFTITTVIVGIIYFALLWLPLGIAALIGRLPVALGVFQGVIVAFHLFAGFWLAGLNGVVT